jgi:NTP pyrophosphatase (non-canonical NTP hydrolase)
MTLAETQERVDRWIRAHGGYWDRFQILARLTEELGEVASALQRDQGLRPKKVDVDVEEELGDLLFTLAAFANVMGLSLQRGTERAIAKYDSRDSAAWRAAQ